MCILCQINKVDSKLLVSYKTLNEYNSNLGETVYFTLLTSRPIICDVITLLVEEKWAIDEINSFVAYVKEVSFVKTL